MSVDFDDSGFGGYAPAPDQGSFENSKLNILMRAFGVPKEYRIQFSIFLVVVVLCVTGLVVYLSNRRPGLVGVPQSVIEGMKHGTPIPVSPEYVVQ